VQDRRAKLLAERVGHGLQDVVDLAPRQGRDPVFIAHEESLLSCLVRPGGQQMAVVVRRAVQAGSPKIRVPGL
jgi:hypothetical protein